MNTKNTSSKPLLPHMLLTLAVATAIMLISQSGTSYAATAYMRPEILSGNALLIGLIGVGLLVITIAVVVICIIQGRRRKKARMESPASAEQSPETAASAMPDLDELNEENASPETASPYDTASDTETVPDNTVADTEPEDIVEPVPEPKMYQEPQEATVDKPNEYRTTVAGEECVFTDEYLKINRFELSYSEMENIRHQAGTPSLFIFEFRGKTIRFPYREEEKEKIVPFFAKAAGLRKDMQ